jgi:hypothetical protein
MISSIYNHHLMKIPVNEGTTDRIIRLIASILMALASYMWLTGTWQIVLYVFSGMIFVTSVIGYCGLYQILGINTCRLDKK